MPAPPMIDSRIAIMLIATGQDGGPAIDHA